MLSVNAVVDVQQHFVKPQPNELAETVLTEDCKTETGLDEELVKQAPPLDHALEEFDRFLSAKGVHPDHGGRSFCLLTDGQSHLRQCVQHECCKKNITLPSYFYRFYDLRKEFRKFYKTDVVSGIKFMIDFRTRLWDYPAAVSTLLRFIWHNRSPSRADDKNQ
ncbi:epithelial splicing regulatory protein 2 [Plakobranchus ocellatus]|uniref:Epithelial splicing regulatory protein 2 n=1 Tax=Plakobranchus ocellatus TaxID=259542 RepID=A0AAV4C038_9GAST|nr:epithelial splicing regulatory protein 2 [Plakobranchus ocellatus]